MADTVLSNCMLFMLLSKVEDSIGIMRVIVFFRCGVEMQMGLIWFWTWLLLCWNKIVNWILHSWLIFFLSFWLWIWSIMFCIVVYHVVVFRFYSGFFLCSSGDKGWWGFPVGWSIASILDVEAFEAGPGEMRDVIKVDELSEGLLATILGRICKCRFRCSWQTRRITLV